MVPLNALRDLASPDINIARKFRDLELPSQNQTKNDNNNRTKTITCDFYLVKFNQ